MKIYIFAVISFIILYAGSCNTEHIEGYIKFDTDEISINDSLFLEAIVTSDIEPYDVLWEMMPPNSDAVLISPIPNDTSKDKAVFVAQEIGEFTISIRFLYKNTNPKESDSILIKVTE